MKPRIKVITLGVDDLQRSLVFYRDGMGLPTQGIIGTEFEDGAAVFFHMNDDLILALYPRAGERRQGARQRAKRLGALDRPHRQVEAGSRRGNGAGRKGRRPDHGSGARPLLGRVLRVLPGSGRAPVGNRLESAVGGQGIGDGTRVPVVMQGTDRYCRS